jgi:hypothetical protein
MFHTTRTLSRRDYLRAGSLGFFGLDLAKALAAAAPAKGKKAPAAKK